MGAPPRDELRAEVLDLIRRVSISSTIASRHIAHHLGMHATDFDAVMVLNQRGRPLLVSELGRELELSSAAVTVAVDRLEAAGHVTRSRDRADRRKVHVTRQVPEGWDGVAYFAALGAAIEARLTDVSARELAGAVKVLAAAAAALDAVAAGEDPRARTDPGTGPGSVDEH